MSLHGIKSLNEVDFMSTDIRSFLLSEGFCVCSKSNTTKVTPTKTPVKLFKVIGGDDNNVFKCWVTGSEIVVENAQAEHDTPVCSFKCSFDTDSSFVDAYNKLVDFYVNC